MQPTAATCPNCHQPVAAGATFCGNCGFNLTQATAPGTPATAPAPAPGVVPAPPAPAVGVPTPAISAVPPVPGSTTVGVIPPAPGNPMVGTMPPVPGTPAAPHDASGKAIAALVLGVLGLVGWLVPIIGMILGILAIIFGTTSMHTRRRGLAIAGTIIAVPVILLSLGAWVYNAQQLHKNAVTGSSSSQSSTAGTQTKAIASSCYNTQVPVTYTVSQTSGSCTFTASDSVSGNEYDVKTISAPSVTADTLPTAAQADAQNVANTVSGSTITSEDSDQFAGQPAYIIHMNEQDGSTITLAYVYHPTGQGNVVIAMHAAAAGQSSDLGVLENSWVWL